MREIHTDFLLHFKTLLLSQNTHKNVGYINKKSRKHLMGSKLKKTLINVNASLHEGS